MGIRFPSPAVLRFCLPAALLLCAFLVACPSADTRGSDQQAVEAAQPPQPSLPKGAQAVSFATTDRFQIAAWYWAPKPGGKAKAPGVILLHMRGKDKSSWDGLPDALVAEGYAVLAIDLRGHGQSLDSRGASIPLNNLKDGDYRNMLLDVAAAHAWLATQSGVDGDRVAIVGASIGANLGLLYASGNRSVRTVICLSPGLDYRSLRALEALQGLGKRAIYLLAAKGDSYSYDTVYKIQEAATQANPASVRTFDGKEHGTDLLGAHPGLEATIVSGWLLNYLPPVR